MNFHINESYQLLRDYGGENWSVVKYVDKHLTFGEREAMISPWLTSS